MCMPGATILSGEKSVYEHTESSANGNTAQKLSCLVLCGKPLYFIIPQFSISDFKVPSSCCYQMSLLL